LLKPHRTAKDATNLVYRDDPLANLPQEFPVGGPVRPAHPGRKGMQQVNIDIGNILRDQLEGLNANGFSHRDSSSSDLIRYFPGHIPPVSLAREQ
jgi:hypothetical protein